MELDGKELEKLKELVPYKILSPTPQEIITEIERLNNIIKEAREYIESYMPNYDFDKTNLTKLLEILNKENK
jgi:hypothetical protein